MIPERLTQASDKELEELSDLCLRSKAYWGYDRAFMDACKEVLRVTRQDLDNPTAVVRDKGGFIGFVRLCLDAPVPELSKLFVCPDHIGQGVGSALITWAKTEARDQGCHWLHIESDPDAQPFYEAHGAVQIGQAPSEVIPNRVLPLLRLSTAAT